MNSIDEIKKKALEDHIPIIMDDTLETVGQILKSVQQLDIQQSDFLNI